MTVLPHDPVRERMLAQDLLDALWQEDLYGMRKHCRMVAADDAALAALAVDLGAAGTLLWLGRRLDGPRPLQLGAGDDRPPVVLQRDGSAMALGAAAALEALQSADWWPGRSQRLQTLFALAEAQAAQTLAHEPAILDRLAAAPRSLLSWEAVCCLRDRPFHPLARAKAWGNAAGPHAGFDAESGQPVWLHWIAVPLHRLRTGSAMEASAQPLARSLLQPDALDRLAARAQAAGAQRGYLWMPVHPWQWQQQAHVATDSRQAPCIDLGGGIGAAYPTASLRSLVMHDHPALHLKLSLGMQALGASRTLPVRYLHNGALAQQCLAQLRDRDPWLAQHLLLCDERDWWALRQHDALIAEPGDLACMLRRYPGDLAPGTWLLPMAACAALTASNDLPALRRWSCTDASQAWAAFRRIAALLLETGLRCFANGVMPELHGQNVVLVVGDDGPRALLLRDHDTLRICPSLLAEAGVDMPAYAVDTSTPNTLVLDTPAQLLAYFQTLAIEVNLYAIAAAIAVAFDSDERLGWRILGEEIATLLPAGTGNRTTEIARAALLDAPDWPFKQLLAPLLARESAGTGMPSALGSLRNPLHDNGAPS
ncbi:siderophore biosynthesis protein [Cupriavidus necator]|uniref:Siderophore biosynthesis protein n=1 Tax=Cupriavidus necator TaxID=106590 RepID=A0A1U9UMN5_CUPNE|nr:IucA/IucC family protein [Cupriavidus necator]AQV93893.1 siderophore biosynthesis protein [Cupriavidus necator]